MEVWVLLCLQVCVEVWVQLCLQELCRGVGPAVFAGAM